MKNRLILVLVWVGGWLSLLAPIGIYVYANKEHFFATVENAVRIGLSVVFIGAVIVPIVIKKAKLGLLTILLFITALLGLLKPILADLKLMMIIFTISYAVYKYIFTPLTNYFKLVCKTQLEANINARAMARAFKPKEEVSGRV